MDRDPRFKEKLGAFIHHPATSLGVVTLILISVSLVVAHLMLPEEHPYQGPIEAIQLLITALFAVELSIKYYVAPSKLRYFATYWVDIVAVVPWAQSLRVLRVLRLLRVFRVAIILSRRVRFVSALFRSAVGEYVVLGLIMALLLAVGTFTLFITESRARQARVAQEVVAVDRELSQLEVELGLRPPFDPGLPSIGADTVGGAEEETPRALQLRLDAFEAAVRAKLPADLTLAPAASLPPEPRRLLLATGRLRLRLPDPASGSDPEDLATFENSFWATLFFLVATEPMIGTPSTPVGRAVVLAVMFGGLTTFALFTGIVTALMVNRLKRRLEIDDMDRYQLIDHLVILGWNRLVPLIIEEVTQAPGQEDAPVVVLADLDEHPPEVALHAGRGRVYFVKGDYTKPEALELVRVRHAKRAIIVADTTIPRSDQDRDARTVLAALMVERMNPQIYTCAELLNRDNEPHLRAAGIEEVVLTSDAGGHHLALAALHTGIADVLDELMTGKRGGTLLKWPVPDSYVGLPFSDALARCKQERDALLIGVEVAGRDGPRAEGYAMRLNPGDDLRLGEHDNMVVIATRNERS